MNMREVDGFVCGPCQSDQHYGCKGWVIDSHFCNCHCLAEKYDEQVGPSQPTDEELEAMRKEMGR